NHSLPILNNIVSSLICLSPIEERLLILERETKEFLSSHPNIICIHADKGNTTVVLDRDNAFNSFHPRLKFTLEVGDNYLNFLDTSIIIKDNFLIFDWYRKPTFVDVGTFRYCEECFMAPCGACTLGVSVFICTGDVRVGSQRLFPQPQVDAFCPLSARIKVIIHNNLTGANISFNNKEPSTGISWFTVPYVPVLTKKFKQFDRNDIKVSFFSSNKLNKYIKVQKDRVDSPSKSNVVYKINCKDCDASYVGQTGRRLKTRIAEHRNHIRWNTSSKSVITEHRLQQGHDFNWNDIRILDEEHCYNKRLVS
ncbi:hypothetical protein ALC57_10507, partial [Trachymyrmex cornetzi]